jgi:hypothetical protein
VVRSALDDRKSGDHESDAGDRFPVFATERQFNRYDKFWYRKQWAPLTLAALAALGQKKRAPSQPAASSKPR